MNNTRTCYCSSCGKPIEGNFNVCPYCGTPIQVICHKCGMLMDKNVKNCPSCGEKVNNRMIERGIAFTAKDLRGIISSLLSELNSFIKKLWLWIKSFVLLMLDLLGKLLKKVGTWLRRIEWGRFGQHSKAFIEKLNQMMHVVLSWIMNTIVHTWKLIKTAARHLYDSFSQFYGEKISPIFRKKGGTGIFIACMVGVFLFIVFFPWSRDLSQQPQIIEPVQNIPSPVTVDPSQQKWLVMIYADADDDVLENDIYFDLNEAEAAGSTDRVQIVAQIDRYKEGFTGDGDWTGARRYFIQQDDDLNAINSDLLMDLGEVDMGADETLVDFVTWAIQTYPADRYALILSDHGSGWIGGWYDDDPINPDGNFISLNQMDIALGMITEQTGIEKFDLIGMDACLMGMLEVYSSLEPHARYAVASEEVEPSMGWAYSYFLAELKKHPEIKGADLARAIVDGYIQQDLRIRDELAYKELLADYELPDTIDRELISEKFAERVTLSAVDLSVMAEFNQVFNELLLLFKDMDQSKLAEARSYAQAYLNIFDDGFPSPYIDLHNFLTILSEYDVASEVSAQITDVQAKLNKLIISEVHGSDIPGSYGISIYFPISQHYWEGGKFSYEWYPIITKRFSDDSLWDDFLAYHYAGLDFEKGIPDIGSKAVAPGYSEIIISTPVISPTTVVPGNTKINIQADVQGDHIAYLYLVSMFRYENRLLFYETDFILGDDSVNVDGVIYPYYERVNGVKHLDVDYEMYATAISNGQTAAFAVLQPETYGTSPEETIYSVKGFYLNSLTGEKVSATMYFYNYGDNEMRNIIGYFGDREKGYMPAEIVPKTGDQFQFVDTWWVVDDDGKVTEELRDGNSLTFSGQPLRAGVASQFVYPGEYSIGIGAEDMDGNQTFSFASLIIEDTSAE